MELNKQLRRTIVEMACCAGEGHIPSAFSIVEVLEALYSWMRVDPSNPKWPDRDYFILSKGHGCLALYVVLEKHGFISHADLDGYCQPGCILGEHPEATIPGVEMSTGSLGHGLPFGVGLALGLRLLGKPNRVFVLVGDGECNEGTTWESATLASHLHLGNLCCIVDDNGSAILPMHPLAAKWSAFGWHVWHVDGHSPVDLSRILNRIAFAHCGRPQALIAHTIKGKGVPFMEGAGQWHHRIPDSSEREKIKEAL